MPDSFDTAVSQAWAASPLDDPCYDDLFATAAALGQPIFLFHLDP